MHYMTLRDRISRRAFSWQKSMIMIISDPEKEITIKKWFYETKFINVKGKEKKNS